MTARALHWALGPVSAIRLESFRWTTTLVLLIYTLTWSLEASEWLTPVGYHVSAAASRGLQLPIPLLGRGSLVAFLLIYVGSMVGILLDLRPRLCSYVVFMGLLYVTLADRLSAFSMNKLALVAYLVLLLAPWPATGSAGRDAPDVPDAPDSSQDQEHPQLRSAWPLRILQATVLLQYVGAGVCKLRGNWLTNPQVLWLQAQDVYMTKFAAWMVREVPVWGWTVLQHGALAFELLAPLLLCVRRLRPLGFAWGLAMHVGIALMMHRVGLFSLSVVAYYVLFVDEAHLFGLRERLRAG
ncbi:HTTM domain-containing protein [Enhygromyxa salina]|uniref:HTTM domain-containing protein n=1 Tax=Enhygromyxa salina TaxID=215803 RepID=UPI0015E7B329|nr:HTTM domain-containing protein [Enhygromyxa salina]